MHPQTDLTSQKETAFTQRQSLFTFPRKIKKYLFEKQEKYVILYIVIRFFQKGLVL